MTKRINFAAGFSAAVAERAKVWEHDRSLTVGASEVFNCMRQNAFKKLSPELAEEPEEADPEWGHTERGNLVENEFVVPSLKSMFGEENCLFMGAAQKTFIDGRLSATPDGVVIGLPRDALADYGIEDIGESEAIATEVKSFGSDYAAPKKDKATGLYIPKPRHQGQNIVQMGLLRRKTNYFPDVGVVLYVNPVNLKDIRPATVRYDDAVYTRAKNRAESIFVPGKTPADFAAEGLITKKDCQYCDFCSACHDIEMARFPDKIVPAKNISANDLTEIEHEARVVAALRAKMKEVEEEKKIKETSLKDKLFDIGTTKVAGDGWSVSISKNAGRKSLDKEKLVADTGVDLDDYMKTGDDYYVMRVKG